MPCCRRHTCLGTKHLLFNVSHTYWDMYEMNFTGFFSPDNFCTMKSLRTKRKERLPVGVRELLQHRLSLLKQHAHRCNSRYKDSPQPVSIPASLWDFTNALG